MTNQERRAFETDLAFVEDQIENSSMPPDMVKLFQARADSHRDALGLTATTDVVVELPTVSAPETLAA